MGFAGEVSARADEGDDVTAIGKVGQLARGWVFLRLGFCWVGIRRRVDERTQGEPAADASRNKPGQQTEQGECGSGPARQPGRRWGSDHRSLRAGQRIVSRVAMLRRKNDARRTTDCTDRTDKRRNAVQTPTDSCRRDIMPGSIVQYRELNRPGPGSVSGGHHDTLSQVRHTRHGAGPHARQPGLLQEVRTAVRCR